MNTKTIVFDMDGVIFDSEKIVIECWRALNEKYGFDNFDIVYQKCIGVNVNKSREIFKSAYGQDFPYDDYRAETSKMFREKSNNGLLPIKPGVLELLSYLKENKWKIGLASSTREEVVRAELQIAGLIDFFDSIVCGDQVTNSKPDPEIYLKACESLNSNPSDTYAVEDAYNGVRSASSAGMITIMVPDLLPPNEEMEKLSSFIFDDLNKVLDYFKCNG